MLQYVFGNINMKKILERWPEAVKTKIETRERWRRVKNFTQADVVRQQLEAEGYELRDGNGGVEVWVNAEGEGVVNSRLIGLFGSGETAAAGGKTHEALVKSLGKDAVRIALIATPAGFQPNVEIVYQEIADYLSTRLQNYHPQITLVKAFDRDTANNEMVISPVFKADYIFTGPGSPSYAVKNLRGTKLSTAIFDRFEAGAVMGLASSAVIAFSHYCLPVYEIYKVGERLHWLDGLNGYATWLKREISVIPHFNNTEGGKKTDTSRCFMGKDRFEQLLTLLPACEEVWGIDEQTAVIIDISTGKRTIYGEGRMTMVQGGK